MSILKNFATCIPKLRRKYPWEEEGGVWMCDSFDDFEGFLNAVVEEAQGGGAGGGGIDEGEVLGGAESIFADCEGEEWGGNVYSSSGKCVFVNPAARERLGASKILEILYCFGQVLGLAVRTGVRLEGLRLSPVIWKVWSGIALSRVDIYRISESKGLVSDILAQMGTGLGVTDNESFNGLLPDLNIGGQPVAGVEDSKQAGTRLRIRVLQGCAREIRAMYEGLTSIVPASAFVLFCSHDLEQLVKGEMSGWSGVADIDGQV